jgi:hypothetical protein
VRRYEEGESMTMTSITTKGLNEEGELQVLFMFDPVIDGGSGVRKMRSWNDLQSTCLANEIDYDSLMFNPEVLDDLQKAWGKAPS